ncbi:MAG: hypothetical protein R3B06_03135 [Kofleriaceae bacterium]
MTAEDAAAVNALVPPELAGAFTFEVRTLDAGDGRARPRYTLVAPRGWTPGFLPGALENPAEATRSNSDGHNTVRVDRNCDGECRPKDWAKVVAAVEYAQYLDGQVPGTIVKDDVQATSRTMVFQRDQTITRAGDTTSTTGTKERVVIHTWWTPGASAYHSCVATTANDTTALAAAWERACAKVAVEQAD